jgi:hypothetical protein
MLAAAEANVRQRLLAAVSCVAPVQLSFQYTIEIVSKCFHLCMKPPFQNIGSPRSPLPSRDGGSSHTAAADSAFAPPMVEAKN